MFNNMFAIFHYFENLNKQNNSDDQQNQDKSKTKKPYFKLYYLLKAYLTMHQLLYNDNYLHNIKKSLKIIDPKQNLKISEFALQEEQQRTGKEQSWKTQLQFNVYNMKGILNELIQHKKNYKIVELLTRQFPELINFDNKLKSFRKQVDKLRIKDKTIKLQLRRDHLFSDAFTQIINKKSYEMLMPLEIEFKGERGVDQGGLTRAFFQKISQDISNPNYALFKPAVHGYALQPNPSSHVNEEHLNYFKFVGRIVGKALLENQLMDVHFTRCFYKNIVGEELTTKDFEDYDPTYHRNLQWLLNNEITDAIEFRFSYMRDQFGRLEECELKEGGRDIPVTDENKGEYVRLMCYAKMALEIKDQIGKFKEGLNEVIPQSAIDIFKGNELELMISGCPVIDIQDLKRNTLYYGYTSNSQNIINFWKVLEDFDENLKAGFLQFVTGTSKIPYQGFKNLKGSGENIQKFNIHKLPQSDNLPTSHTCVNQLDLPDYQSLETLREKLTIAIKYGKEGFAFA